MARFYNSQGDVLTPGKELGRGGEGSVFTILESPESVAKIYHASVSAEKAEKLRQMVALKSDKLLRLSAWVTDVLQNEAGETIGFLMPRLSFGTQIHELYNPASRRRRFPEADWRFLIRAAANSARAFAVVHQHGHSIGDVNHGNIVIARDATVRLIDCDSYHLNAPERSFLCEVGVSTHTPPELQGKSLRDVARTENHDNFGLAVLIFQLLFMGRHPFSGKFLGDGENTLENSIRERRFAYGEDAPERQMNQPPGTLPLDAVSPNAASLFRRAFLEIKNRPTAREWADALDQLENDLRECNFNQSHFYWNGLEKCAWCAVEAQTGVLFFPARFNENFVADPNADLVTIGRLIDAIKPPDVPSQLPVKISGSVPDLPASPQIAEAVAKFNRNLALYLAALSVAIIFVITFFGSAIFSTFILFFYICTAVIKSLTETAKNEAQTVFDSASRNLEKFRKEWKKLAGKEVFTKARTELKNAVTEFKNLPAARAGRFKELENEFQRRQLIFYLKGFPLRRAEIKHLTEAQIKELNKFQIVSADDISVANFRRVPYFSQQHKNRLFAWRIELERNFVFHLTPQNKRRIEEKIEAEFEEKRRRLETEIRSGLPRLQRLSVEIANNYQTLSSKSEQIEEEFVSAEIDLGKVSELKTKAIGWTIGVAAASLLVTMPFKLSADHNAANNRSEYLYGRSVNTGEIQTVYRAEREEFTPKPHENADNYYLEDGTKITPETWGKAFDFYRDGINKTSSGDYEKAAKSFQKAINFQPDVSELRVRLGESFFLAGRYRMAIIAFNDALKINPFNSSAYHLLGTCYNKLLRRDDAIKAFKNAVEVNADAAFSLYELGKTLREDKKPNEAIDYLNAALKKQPELNAARFELALCYDEAGFRNLALREFEKLDSKDSDLSEKLAIRLGVKTESSHKEIKAEIDSQLPPTIIGPNSK
ncbi:MAG TPA: tetratricopeptide repeat protein [Pyrinomonadaceae bacterium]|jgi:DNA-binding helix-hairpin-helix protein with protein kinase domain